MWIGKQSCPSRMANRVRPGHGYGHLNQGRFKSFPIQRDQGRPPAHRLPLRRAQRADGRADQRVKRAEDWRWGSLRVRMHGPKELAALLAPWPEDRPAHWTEHVNAALTGKEIERLEVSERRGRPFGSDAWVARTVARLGMQHTVRPEGRPKKDEHDHQPPSAAKPQKRN